MRNFTLATMLLCVIAISTTAQKKHTVEYPFYKAKNTRTFDITKVMTDKEYTTLEVCFYASQSVRLAKESTLTGNDSGKKYKLLRSEGIETDSWTTMPECLYMKATLYFEPLDAADLSFDFSEGENVSNGWEIKGVSLTPYNLKDIIEKDKKWGKKTISPFSGEYNHDTIRVELDIKNTDSEINMWSIENFHYKDTEFTNGKHTYPIQTFNTINIFTRLPNGTLYRIIASPGDTVRISYDGSNRQASTNTADNEMQRCINEYYKYQQENGIYVSPVSYMLSPQQLFYEEISGTLKRDLLRLQNFIAEHPGFNNKAAYFLRTIIKAEALRSILQYRFNIKKQQQKQFSKEMMALINELLTDIPSPITLNSDYETIVRDYVGYKEDLANIGLSIKLTLNSSTAMLALNSYDKIKLSKKDIHTIERYGYLTSLRLATALNMVKDTIKAAKELQDTTKIFKRYNALLDKHLNGKISATEIRNYALVYDFNKVREGIMQLPFPEDDKKLAILTLNYNKLTDDNKSINDTVLQMVSAGMEEFAPLRTFVEQNDYIRRLEAEELEIKYLKNYADITPETLTADSLLSTILEPHKGKVVYADFWGTWCSPCKMQMSYMPAVKEALKGKDVVYIYFADNSPEDVRQTIVKKYGIYGENTFHYNLPTEQQRSLYKLLNINSFPTYLLFDKKGRIVNRNAPPPQQKDLLINEIQQYLDEE